VDGPPKQPRGAGEGTDVHSGVSRGAVQHCTFYDNHPLVYIELFSINLY
jgi:hypothetical protein